MHQKVSAGGSKYHVGATVQPRPVFHLQPEAQGWLNDPNGVHYDPATKLYHMFWQHYGTGSSWRWGLSWGHACSKDLVTWHYLPPALEPTPDSYDADGVWSGCAFPTDDGTVILNTAVRLRTNTPDAQLPRVDLGQPMIETQAYARADNMADPLLRVWTKGKAPMLQLPPHEGLSGWRDPFLIGRPGDGVHDKWTIMIGSGHAVPVSAGAVLVYTSDNPTSGWEYRGELCRGDGSTGSMWECPVLVRLPLRDPDAPVPEVSFPSSNGSSSTAEHLLVVGPDNAHHAPVYQLGRYDPSTLTFDTEQATRFLPLDLGGPTFYAPNALTNDPRGRVVMWGWCQELGRPEGDHSSACCLSLPRQLWRHPAHPGRLWQEPLPELKRLRKPANGGWHAAAPIVLRPGQHVDIPGSLAQHCELEVTMVRPKDLSDGATRVAKTGLVLPGVRVTDAPRGEASGRHGAALVFDWKTGRLDLVYSDGSVPVRKLAALPGSYYPLINRRSSVSVDGHAYAHDDALVVLEEDYDGEEDSGHHQEEALHKMDTARIALNIAGCHAVGGVLHGAGPDGAAALDHLCLRIFLDGSLMEVFTSTGEVLTARVYRDTRGCGGAPGMQLASFGTPACVESVQLYALASIWETPAALEALEEEVASMLGTTSASDASLQEFFNSEGSPSKAHPVSPPPAVSAMLP